ncbi:MAG: hypothetical protein M1833_000176 [Piccolia ochrophora]|nr:MAG: hypothetical protein M1833_000176 [Piccolia ochrophora]
MRLITAITSISLLLSLEASANALPKPIAGVGDIYSNLHNSPGRGKALRRDVDQILDRLERRQSPSSPPAAPAPSTSAPPLDGAKMSPEQWEVQTEAACLNYMSKGIQSPSGLAVCYNLPKLDNSTGAFNADLRLYRIAPPTGEWVGIVDEDVTVGLVYSDASLESTSKSTIVRRDVPSARLEARQDAKSPELLQGFKYVGQLNENIMSKPMNLTQLEALLTPVVTLSAETDGKKVTDELSSKEASFVSGTFQAFTSAEAAAVAATSGPFVMPGTSLEVFPIGLIITGIWALIGMGVVVWGTVGRYQFREQYRRRVKRGQTAAGTRKI